MIRLEMECVEGWGGGMDKKTIMFSDRGETGEISNKIRDKMVLPMYNILLSP